MIAHTMAGAPAARARGALALLGAALLSGCAALTPERVQMPQTAEPVWPSPQPEQVVANGSIYQAASHRPLFEDYRARLAGDTLTIRIVEKLSATQSSKSTVSREGSADAGITAFPFLKAPLLGKLGVSGSSSGDHKGTGQSSSTNDFTGTITATVVGVLANGQLLVAGEKQIGVNSNVDVLRFTGQVDPRTIGQRNTVDSTQVANVRIEQRGRGAAADANTVGWLGRVFMSVAPF